MLGHEGKAFAKTSSNCSGEGRASGWMQGRAARVVGLCGMVFLALAGCQQSRPAPVMEEDLLACQQRPENHSSQFCDRITRAYRIYKGAEGSESDQNTPAQTTRSKFKAAKLTPSDRRVQSRDNEPRNLRNSWAPILFRPEWPLCISPKALSTSNSDSV